MIKLTNNLNTIWRFGSKPNRKLISSEILWLFYYWNSWLINLTSEIRLAGNFGSKGSTFNLNIFKRFDAINILIESATLGAEIPRKSDYRGKLIIHKFRKVKVSLLISFFRLVERQSRLSHSNNISKTVNDEESISSLSI